MVTQLRRIRLEDMSRSAFEAGIKLSENPQEPGSEDYTIWHDNWLETQARYLQAKQNKKPKLLLWLKETFKNKKVVQNKKTTTFQGSVLNLKGRLR